MRCFRVELLYLFFFILPHILHGMMNHTLSFMYISIDGGIMLKFSHIMVTNDIIISICTICGIKASLWTTSGIGPQMDISIRDKENGIHKKM